MLLRACRLTHTARVQWFFGFLLLLASGSLFGCEEPRSKGDPAQKDAGKSTSATGEQSPNARILPEPLENGLFSLEDDDKADRSGLLVEPREPARPFPMNQALTDDSLKRGPATGLEMEFQIVWPEVRRSIQVGTELVDTWPRFQVQLLREMPGRPARMRWMFVSSAFPFPELTEIRARADRIGHLVLWPDRRSYRVAPTGSLHALFADRRVDRVPFVEPEKVTKSAGARLGKPTVRSTIVTPVGTSTLEFVEVTDLAYASELLCTAFLEVVRVKSSAELCPLDHLPVHFEIKWLNGEGIQFSVLSWGTAASLEQDDFRMPPDLPIYKRGELPPFEDYFLDEKTRDSVLPLSREKAPSVSPAPLSASASGPVPGAPPSALVPGPPRNQIVLQNQLSRPLVIVLNKIPYIWLSPGTSKEIYLSAAEIRVSARDFLGETIFVERTLVAPAKVDFGETAGEAKGAQSVVPGRATTVDFVPR